jgi:hypothetical protein
MIQVVFLAAEFQKPLLLEGPAGSGKMQPWLFDMALTNPLNKKPLPYKDLTF